MMHFFLKYLVMKQVVGVRLTEGRDVPSGQDTATMLQSENAFLKKHLAAIQEIDDEEFERLYSRMGKLSPIQYACGVSR